MTKRAHPTSARLNRGFSLLEALGIALAVLVAVGIYLGWQAQNARTVSRQAAIDTQAMEMVQVARAADQWLQTPGRTLPAAGSYINVALDDLRNGVYLPVGFAARSAESEAAVSPLGQPYRVSAVMRSGTATPVYEIVVYADGAPDAGLMARAGVKNADAELRQYAVDVMREQRRRYQVASALISSGQSVIDTNASGFTYNLATWMAPAPSNDTAITMLHFVLPADIPGGQTYVPGCIPDKADPFKCVGATPTPGSCTVVNPQAGSASSPTCPSGTYLAAYLDACAVFNQSYTDYIDPVSGTSQTTASALAGGHDPATYTGLKLWGVFPDLTQATGAGTITLRANNATRYNGRTQCSSGWTSSGACTAPYANTGGTGTNCATAGTLNNVLAGAPFELPPQLGATGNQVVGFDRTADVQLDGVTLATLQCLRDKRNIATCDTTTSTWTAIAATGPTPVLCCQGSGPPPPPPAPKDPCLVAGLTGRNWTVSGNSCSAQTPSGATQTIPDGSKLLFTDNSAKGNTGAAYFACSNGLLSITAEPGATCAPPAAATSCSSAGKSWTVGGVTCSGPPTVSPVSSGTAMSFDSTNGNTGSASFACSSGSLAAFPTTASCTTGSVCTLPSPSTESQTVACPAGYTGSITQTRTASCPSPTGSYVWSAWTETSNTCAPAVSCTLPTPSTESQTVACPAPQAGEINQSRSASCDSGGNVVWSPWSDVSNTCTGTCTLPNPSTQTNTETQVATRTVGCSAGYYGSRTQSQTQERTQTRDAYCPSSTGSYEWGPWSAWSAWLATSSWQTTSSTCTKCPSPETETKSLTCPSGQTGTWTQTRTRTFDCANGVWNAWSAWTDSTNTCASSFPPSAYCGEGKHYVGTGWFLDEFSVAQEGSCAGPSGYQPNGFCQIQPTDLLPPTDGGGPPDPQCYGCLGDGLVGQRGWSAGGYCADNTTPMPAPSPGTWTWQVYAAGNDGLSSGAQPKPPAPTTSCIKGQVWAEFDSYYYRSDAYIEYGYWRCQ